MYPKTNPILTEIQDELAVIGEDKHINFVWTPGHAGIEGNEKADEAAQEALQQYLLPELTGGVTDMIAKAKFNAKRIVERNWQQSDIPMTLPGE
jgi:ribonuclease HI